jgi:hypothetical protein
MRVFDSPGTIKRFRKTAWEFQQTFRTPLQALPSFVDAIMTALPRFESGIVVFDQVIFEPRYGLPKLYAKYGIAKAGEGQDVAIEADNAEEANDLLQAVLSEWIDFLFVPTPKPFVIYADHDEHATFFAHRKAGVTKVVEAMAVLNLRPVDWLRSVEYLRQKRGLFARRDSRIS